MSKKKDLADSHITPIAMVVADLHLQKRTWRGLPIEGDSYFSLEQVIDDFVASDLDWLFLLGDVLDRKLLDSSPVVFLIEQLQRVRDAGKRVGFLEGQHEMASYLEEAWLRVGGKTCEHMHQHTVKVGGLNIYGLNFQPTGKLQEELDNIPGCANVLLCHQVWADLMGDIAMPQGSFDQIRHATTILTGDKHKSEIHGWGDYTGKDGQKLYVYSPGAIYQTQIDEPCECSYGLLAADGTISRRKLRTRDFEEFAVGTEDELTEFLGNVDAFVEGGADYAEAKHLPPLLHTPLWRITYPSRILDLESRVTKIVAGRAHLFWKEIRPETSEKVQQLRATVSESGALTLASCLSAEVDKEQEPKVFDLCQRLLESGETEAEILQALDVWKQEELNDGAEGS